MKCIIRESMAFMGFPKDFSLVRVEDNRTEATGFKTRGEAIDYAKQHNIEVKA